MLKSRKLYVSLFMISSAIISTSVFAQTSASHNTTTTGVTGSSNTAKGVAGTTHTGTTGSTSSGNTGNSAAGANVESSAGTGHGIMQHDTHSPESHNRPMGSHSHSTTDM